MEKIPAVPLFFLIHGAIGLESLMCKVLSRQRVLMNQLLGHRTRVTLRSSPRQDDQNLNLLNSCVGPAETALVSSTCTATAQSFQQGDLVACEASIRFIETLWNFLYGISEQKLTQTAQTQFCCSLIPINLILIAFIWLHLANDHFKNIWSEIEMMNWHCCTWYRGLKVKLPQCGSNFKTSWLPCEVKSASGWCMLMS